MRRSLRAFPDMGIRELAYDRRTKRRWAVARITVLDPTAAPLEGDPDPGPDPGGLTSRGGGGPPGRAWPSFGWVVDEWSRELHAAGAQVHPWRAGNRIGDDGTRTF